MQKLKILKIKEMGSNGMTTEDIKKLQRQYPEKRINHNYNLIGAYMDPDQEFGTLKQAVERPKAANFVIHDERKLSKMVKNQETVQLPSCDGDNKLEDFCVSWEDDYISDDNNFTSEESDSDAF